MPVHWASLSGGTAIGMLVAVSILGTNPSIERPCGKDSIRTGASRTGSIIEDTLNDQQLDAPEQRVNPQDEVGYDDLSQMLKKIADDDKMVVATTTDIGYLELTNNWICHMKKLGIEKQVLVFALDEQIHDAVKTAGLHSYYHPEMSKTADAVGNWNSKSYNQVVHTKTKHQRSVLERGYNLFFADVDIPWTSDFRERIRSDVEGLDFVGQHNWPQSDINTGFMFMRSNVQMLKFMDTILLIEKGIESGTIRSGGDPRHDIFYPTDDQSSTLFVLMCGYGNGSYPGRGDMGAPKGGYAAPGITVQPQWQKRLAARRHALSSRKIQHVENTRRFITDCGNSSGVNISYGIFAPQHYQTGHKDWAKYGFDKLSDNQDIIYHPNFMKGSENKKIALSKYGRWIDDCE